MFVRAGPSRNQPRHGWALFGRSGLFQDTQPVNESFPVIFRKLSQKVQEAADSILSADNGWQMVRKGPAICAAQKIVNRYPVKIGYLYQCFQVRFVYAVFVVGDGAGTAVKVFCQSVLFGAVLGPELLKSFGK